MLNLPTTLPMARYQFEFKVTEDMLLPAYSGSTLRGIFGHALKRVACMTKAKSCDGCPLLQTCPYPEIFEMPVPASGTLIKNKNVPQSYIIEPPEIGERVFKQGEIFKFEMVLLGKVTQRIALINFAWQKALEKGIRNGGKAKFVDMKVQTAQGYESALGGQYVVPHTQVIDVPNFTESNVTIEFETPMRLQQDGHAVAPNHLTAELFLTQLLRRLSWVSEVHFGQTLEVDYQALKAEASQLNHQSELKWYDWARYSNRQQTKMHLGGVLGQWKFYDVSPAFKQLLYIGQWLHAGKNTTFGLGKYRIIE